MIIEIQIKNASLDLSRSIINGLNDVETDEKGSLRGVDPTTIFSITGSIASIVQAVIIIWDRINKKKNPSIFATIQSEDGTVLEIHKVQNKDELSIQVNDMLKD